MKIGSVKIYKLLIKICFLWERRLGKSRLKIGICPKCNSHSPELKDCDVCQGFNSKLPPADKLKAQWWEEFDNYMKKEYADLIKR